MVALIFELLWQSCLEIWKFWYFGNQASLHKPKRGQKTGGVRVKKPEPRQINSFDVSIAEFLPIGQASFNDLWPQFLTFVKNGFKIHALTGFQTADFLNQISPQGDWNPFDDLPEMNGEDISKPKLPATRKGIETSMGLRSPRANQAFQTKTDNWLLITDNWKALARSPRQLVLCNLTVKKIYKKHK